jgi:hypothetical protein
VIASSLLGSGSLLEYYYSMGRFAPSSTQLGAAVLISVALARNVNAFSPSGQYDSSKRQATDMMNIEESCSSRRSFFAAVHDVVTASTAIVASSSLLPCDAAVAKEVDCFQDCFKNCKQIAPKDQQYCLDTCKDYCDQPDRRDGLSGSVSSEGGETGILGLNTVVKGDDKPPEIKIPGLDFSSGSGKKLIGY